jgi:hypothetical protein
VPACALALQAMLLQFVGENVVSIVRKSNPKQISNSGHHRSNQDTDSLDELISTSSCSTYQILTENKAALNLLRL